MKILNTVKDMADELLQKVEDRKFKLALLVFLTSTLALFLGEIDQDVFKTITEWILIVYIGGNVAQKALIKNEPEST